MSDERENDQLPQGATERRILFLKETPPAADVLMRFADPAPSCAVLTSMADVPSHPADFDTLDVTIVRPQDAKQGLAEWADTRGPSDSQSPTYVRYRGVELLWRPGRAVLLCDPEQVDVLLPAVVEFAHYEAELRRIEQEIAVAWTEVEQDKALAFDVTPADLQRSGGVGARMEQTFGRRIRFARIESHLGSPDTRLPLAAQKLGEELREKTALDARAEIVDGQLEVFEHIYEMASQRMGEFKAARQGHIMEWVIIVLLGAEALLMLFQTIIRLHG
jgi:hypothetical protein